MKQECIPVGCVPAARWLYAAVCFPAGGVPGPGGCLLWGVCLVWGDGGAWSRGCILACTEADTLPPVDRILDRLVKILPWPNFVAAGNNNRLYYHQYPLCQWAKINKMGLNQVSHRLPISYICVPFLHIYPLHRYSNLPQQLILYQVHNPSTRINMGLGSQTQSKIMRIKEIDITMKKSQSSCESSDVDCSLVETFFFLFFFFVDVCNKPASEFNELQIVFCVCARSWLCSANSSIISLFVNLFSKNEKYVRKYIKIKRYSIKIRMRT